MPGPVAFLIRFHERLRRFPARRNFPEWLTDAVALLKYADVLGYLLTFFYSAFYARHFYQRLGQIGRSSVAGGRRYPYLLRPIPYLLALLGVLNLVQRLIQGPEINYLRFNLFILAVTAATPLLAAMAIVVVILGVGVVKFFASALPTDGGKEMGKSLIINWGCFRLLCRSRFWRGYHWGEIVPALIYYSVNSILLAPFAVAAFWVSTIAVDKMLAWVNPSSEFYQMMWTALTVVVLGLLGLAFLYTLILRPMLYAIVFRSTIPLLRSGVFPDLLIFGESEPFGDLKRIEECLDADLQPAPAPKAVFVWRRILDAGGRVTDQQILPAKLSVA